jgi:membrane peptidoglycan carboxypeptidase
MTRLLKNVVIKGTAKGIKLANKVEVAGKTGTSNSGGDRWFIGYTPEYVCGVWSGYRDGRDIGEYKHNPACTVFDGIMGNIYDSLERYEKQFPQSAGVVASSYCVDSGELASKACHADLRGSRIETGYFKRGTEPKTHCDTHVLVRYDKVTHAIACDKCPEENIINAGLIKVDRAFPCDVRITDSQYTYMYLPAGIAPATEEDLPYFAKIQEGGKYYGSSGVSKPKNRYCREHFLETTTTVTTATTASAPQSTVSAQTTAPQTTTSPKITAESEKTTSASHTTSPTAQTEANTTNS